MSSKHIVFLIFTFSVIDLFKHYNAQLQTLKCDFEIGMCSFLSNDINNKENWRIGKGKVKSGETGPTIDHTLGTYNGSYIYVDVSRAKNNSVKLLTNALNSDYCVRFFYHMYGADIGGLSVSAESVYGSQNFEYFYRKKTQGDRWKEARFFVSQTSTMRYKGYRISIVAKGRSSSAVWGDIAIDDMELTPGKCKDKKKDAFDLCSFDDYDCGYTSTRMSSMSWEWQATTTAPTYFQETPKQDHTLGTKYGGFWFVGEEGYTNSRIQTVMLSSPVYDKPKTSLNCLHFYVYLDYNGTNWWVGGVKENYIQAFLNFPDSKDSRKAIVIKGKNTTEHAVWTYVEAKAEITQKFQIQFVAGLRTPTEAIAALDDVKLIAGSCPEAGFCDFEQNKCSWIDGKGDYNWIRKTPSSFSNSEIGPDIDNTLGTSSGNYVVFNTKNKKEGSTASLESENFPPSTDTNCISFYYYMKGADLGTLRVNVKQENFTESSVWILKGEQGDEWKQGKALLKPSLMYTQIVFQGITGKGSTAYMALDDIKIRKGEECQLTPSSADPRYEENFGCEQNGGNKTCDDKKRICINKKDNKSEFECGDCIQGYKYENGVCIVKDGCIDLGGNKECIEKGKHWICIFDYFAPNKYKCVCENGFKQQRHQCLDKLECNEECLKKGERWKCVNDNFGFKCACKNGFTKVDNECLAHCTDHKDCLNMAYCRFHNHNNGFFCHCKDGFKGDNCEINEYCANKTCGTIGATCHYVNWLGKAFCICPPNKHFNRDANLCEDENNFPTSIITMTTAIASLLVSMAVLLLVLKKLRSKT